MNLREFIGKFFSEEDLRTLCFDLNIDYEEINRDTKNKTIIALIDYFRHRDRLDDLTKAIKEKRSPLYTKHQPFIPNETLSGELVSVDRRILWGLMVILLIFVVIVLLFSLQFGGGTPKLPLSPTTSTSIIPEPSNNLATSRIIVTTPTVTSTVIPSSTPTSIFIPIPTSTNSPTSMLTPTETPGYATTPTAIQPIITIKSTPFLEDNFNGDSIDANLWRIDGDIIGIGGGRLFSKLEMNVSPKFDSDALESREVNYRNIPLLAIEFRGEVAEIHDKINGVLGFNTKCIENGNTMYFGLNGDTKEIEGSIRPSNYHEEFPFELDRPYTVFLFQDGEVVRVFVDGVEIVEPYPCKSMGEWFKIGFGRIPDGYVAGYIDYVKLWEFVP